MPRLRPKQNEPTRLPPDEFVWATEHLQKGTRYVRRGDRLPRTDPIVLETPQYFEVRYPLSRELSDG